VLEVELPVPEGSLEARDSSNIPEICPSGDLKEQLFKSVSLGRPEVPSHDLVPVTRKVPSSNSQDYLGSVSLVTVSSEETSSSYCTEPEIDVPTADIAYSDLIDFAAEIPCRPTDIVEEIILDILNSVEEQPCEHLCSVSTKTRISQLGQIRVKVEPLELVNQNSDGISPSMEKLGPVNRAMVEPLEHMDMDSDSVSHSMKNLGPVNKVKVEPLEHQDFDSVSPSIEKLGPANRVRVDPLEHADQGSDGVPLSRETHYVCPKCSLVVKSLNSLKRHVGIF
jgi:hypothetical protein